VAPDAQQVAAAAGRKWKVVLVLIRLIPGVYRALIAYRLSPIAPSDLDLQQIAKLQIGSPKAKKKYQIADMAYKL
jgi:hypothetical protein